MKRQIVIVLGVFMALWWGIPAVYMVGHALITGETPPDTDPILVLGLLIAFGWLILGIIYLTIGAAIRHNSRRD